MRILPFLFCCLSVGALAQKPPVTLKTTPLEWINPFKQTFTLHSDWPLSSKFGLELGLGYVFDAVSFASNKGEYYRGPRARASLKAYFNKTEKSNTYVALSAKGSMVDHGFFDPVLRQGGQYEELLFRKRKVNMAALGIIFGTQEFIGRQGRFFVEPFAGLGLRWFEVQFDELVPDAEVIDDRTFVIGMAEEGAHFTPDIVIGIHVGIGFSRNPVAAAKNSAKVGRK
jgi:hypothetical protein